MSNPAFIDLQILMRPDWGEDCGILPVNIDKEATIGDLKKEIERLTEIPARIQLLWCEKDTMEPLEDHLSIWNSERGGLSERVGLEIVLQIASVGMTLKVRTAGFKGPLTFHVYGVDTIADIKQLVLNKFPWWEKLAESEEFDVSLALYSFSGKKFTNDELKIADNDDEGPYMKSVVSVRMKEAVAVTESTESMEIFKISMFDDLLQFYIKAANSCHIKYLKSKVKKVLEIMELGDDQNLRVMNGEILTNPHPNMYAELV